MRHRIPRIVWAVAVGVAAGGTVGYLIDGNPSIPMLAVAVTSFAVALRRRQQSAQINLTQPAERTEGGRGQ